MADDLLLITEWLAKVTDELMPKQGRLRDLCVTRWDYNFDAMGASGMRLITQMTEEDIHIRAFMPRKQSDMDPEVCIDPYEKEIHYSWRDTDVVRKVVWAIYTMLKDMERLHLTLKCREDDWVAPRMDRLKEVLDAAGLRLLWTEEPQVPRLRRQGAEARRPRGSEPHSLHVV